MSKVIDVEGLRKLDPKEIRHTLTDGLYNIGFRDGVIRTVKAREIVFSSYLWEMYSITNLPISSNHIISDFYQEGYFGDKSFKKMMSTIWEYLHFNYLVESDEDHFDWNLRLNSIKSNIVNRIWNDLSLDVLNHTISIDAEDFLDIEDDPRMRTAMKELEDNPTKENVFKTYKALDIVLTDPKYKHVGLAKGYVSNLFNRGQLMQACAGRGVTTNKSGLEYLYPITKSFFGGIDDLYSLTIESSAGAKALSKTTNDIRTVEYTTRRTRLIAVALDRISTEDCKTDDFKPWYVKEKGHPTVGENYKGDLDSLIGLEYKHGDEKGIISKNHTHLLGKEIFIRHAFSCKDHNRNQICYKCYGTKYTSLLRSTNVGRYSASLINVVVMQGELSAKHQQDSLGYLRLVYPGKTGEIFGIKDGADVFFRSARTKKYYLYIPQDEAKGLSNLNMENINSIKDKNPAVFSLVDKVYITDIVRGEESKIPTPHTVSFGKKKLLLSKEFLRYIVENGYELVSNPVNIRGKQKNFFKIKIEDVNTKFIIGHIPSLEETFTDLSKKFESILKGNKTIGKEKGDDAIMDPENPYEVIINLHALLNSKIDVQLTDIATLVYTYCVADRESGDYRLPRNTEFSVKIGEAEIFKYGSLGVSLGYQNIQTLTMLPSAFKRGCKNSSPMDVFIKPKEVLEART